MKQPIKRGLGHVILFYSISPTLEPYLYVYELKLISAKCLLNTKYASKDGTYFTR